MTDEQIDAIAHLEGMAHCAYENDPAAHWRRFARAILAASEPNQPPTVRHPMPASSFK